MRTERGQRRSFVDILHLTNCCTTRFAPPDCEPVRKRANTIELRYVTNSRNWTAALKLAGHVLNHPRSAQPVQSLAGLRYVRMCVQRSGQRGFWVWRLFWFVRLFYRFTCVGFWFNPLVMPGSIALVTIIVGHERPDDQRFLSQPTCGDFNRVSTLLFPNPDQPTLGLSSVAVVLNALL